VFMNNRVSKFLGLIFGMGILILILGGLAVADDLFDTQAADAHFHEGLKLYFKQEYANAIKEFEEAVKIDPDNVKAYYFLGYSYYKLKNMPKAMETFEEAYHLDQRYSPIPQGPPPTQPESQAPPESQVSPEPQTSPEPQSSPELQSSPESQSSPEAEPPSE
jgi:tetratricopeptide (TPR) repeat protein